ncbi:unnamed protein product [Adineta steineri]|uniref:G-protein coupled receptors family 1 profile domain-containing protein n=1 Tax=Adineta steineri TaxID=433720 RepID=A0A819G3P4_9BILA|nr:unnamed protein product [Adineta steineri]CAF3879705.1 unnamed protein product [Adineta steineri]
MFLFSIIKLIPSIESWFIPFDILMILCLIMVILFSIVLLFIIILDKRCHTISLILVANSYVCLLLSACALFSMSIFTLENDLKQIEYQDSFCIFRAYWSYAISAALNDSFLIQALYRYVTVFYSTRLFWQSIRFQLLIICLTWLISFIYPIVFIFDNEILYNIDNQICQLPIRPSFSIFYTSFCIYIIPITIIMLIYFKLFRFVHRINNHVTSVNILFRARRELKMVEHIIILITILLITGFPYEFFILLSFFTTPPKYHFRIAFIFIDVSIILITITLFYFTDLLKVSLRKRIKRRPRRIVPAII